jgi:tRNA G18 (ribose-2'-O)-methylase SpoU
MLCAMQELLDSFWRAVAYCLRPHIILLSVLPLVFMVTLTVGLGFFLWEPAMDQVMRLMESSAFLNQAWQWLESMGAGKLKTVLAPLIVIFGVTPIIVMLSMLVVAVAMTPMMVALVAKRRFPQLEARKGASFFHSVLWSLGSTLAALLALVVSVPLWLVPPLILVLDGVQDPHNLGACLRSADAFGVHAVIAPKDRAVGITATVEKVACGAAETVPYLMVTNLARSLNEMKERGIRIIGTSDDAEHTLWDVDFTGPVAIVLGSEGPGMRQLTRKTCDQLISIPMAGAVESLNVSVAAAICLYEARRQRKG